jgi:iron(II)-dependent oxidoreductase
VNGAPWPSTPIEAVDRWLGEAGRRNGIPVDSLVALGADAYEGDAVASGPIGGIEAGDLYRLQQPFIQRHLAALRLSRSVPAVIAARHAANPLKWGAPVRIAAGRIAGRNGSALDSFLSALLGHAVPGADEQAVVTAAAILASLPAGRVDLAVQAAVQAGLVRIVEHGRLSTASRRDAGRALAREGDPRDLEALLPVAGGAFTMGSGAHPNSAPAHAVTLEAFWIGRYPVVNGLYRQFIEATGRVWRSRDGLLAERANSPAVDLSWHDARACCEWLTIRWRAVGRIGAEQVVRLPTEAEWERAARGVRVEDGLVFPWPGAWQPDHENSEEAGFNDTCAVGLFPLGRSPEGCDDMAGQVWEWTSTLWGTNMATPDFKYPYAPRDGRENSAAPADVRRVLRGACFLSPQEKANCVYRGSLEPDGFWRGNGFRVAVGRV